MKRILTHSRLLSRIWLIWAMVAGISTISSAQVKVAVNPNRCLRLSEAQREWLTPEWQPYLKFSRICPVKDSQRQTVILLLSVRADLYYKAQPGESVTMAVLPHPILFLPSGHVAGSLPYNFPDDPPAELRVTFTRWEHDFPQQIELFLTDPRASGNRSLPALVWSESQRKYLAKEAALHD